MIFTAGFIYLVIIPNLQHISVFSQFKPRILPCNQLPVAAFFPIRMFAQSSLEVELMRLKHGLAVVAQWLSIDL